MINFGLVVGWVFFLAARVFAADAPSISSAAAQVSSASAGFIAFEQFALANGMRVILAEDHAIAVVTVGMIFPVGGRQEERGRSGFAHLFEHLMFQGSAHAPKGKFDRLLESQGADNNASTHEDFTFYYETLPAHALPLALWLDADRLSALDVNWVNMRNQVDVVKEEKRMSVDNQPYGPLLSVEISSRVFSNWANAHPVIGSFSDLDAATLKDARAFFKRHYAARQAALAVVGDFNAKIARREIERYFAWIPNQGSPTVINAAETPQEGERSFVIEDTQAKAPALAIAWSGMPARGSPDYYALTLLGRIFFEGKSSLLYQSLVKEKQVATSVDGGLGFPVVDWTEYKEPGVFGAFVIFKSSFSAAAVKGMVYDEIARVASQGVDPKQLERVKTKFRSDWALDHQTTLGRAAALLRAVALDGKADAANGELDRFLAVNESDIKAVAAKYLAADKANVFEDKPMARVKSGDAP